MADQPKSGIKTREVLIIGLVLVILAISLVAYFQSRKSDASAVVSARNLQQWGIALNLYLIENENQLPTVGTSPITTDQTTAWFNALPPYLGQSALAELPAGQRPKPGERSLWINPAIKAPRVWDPEVFFFAYGMNRFLQPDPALRSFKIYELTYPGNIVFLTETDGYEPAATPESVIFRTEGGRTFANVLFCDGHVAPVTRETLVDDPASREAATAATGPSWFEQ